MIMKSFARRYIFSLIATTYFQGIFKRLHRLTLWSMNIGLGGHAETSGEEYAFKRAIKNIVHKSNQVVVFDVGANKGQFAKLILNHIKETEIILHCFEPSKNTFKDLEKEIDKEKNVVLHNFGLSDSEQSLTLYYTKSGAGTASIYQRKVFENVEEISEVIALKKLDDICMENSIEHIHYLKLDVEGHELAALNGALRYIEEGRISYIQFEFGGCNIDSRTYLRDFFEVLSENYVLNRIVKNGLVPITHYSETMEIFTTTNFLAISRSLA
jgi:FkbM family methyltransferase